MIRSIFRSRLNARQHRYWTRRLIKTLRNLRSKPTSIRGWKITPDGRTVFILAYVFNIGQRRNQIDLPSVLAPNRIAACRGLLGEIAQYRVGKIGATLPGFATFWFDVISLRLKHNDIARHDIARRGAGQSLATLVDLIRSQPLS